MDKPRLRLGVKIDRITVLKGKNDEGTTFSKKNV
jgi:hypothetical protein